MVPRERALTLVEVTDELLAEFNLRRGAMGTSYHCDDARAVLVPMAELTVPSDRKLNEEATRSLLSGIRDRAALPPIIVFREPGAPMVALLDGLHRYRVSRAVGFNMIPALHLSRDDAEAGFCYAGPR